MHVPNIVAHFAATGKVRFVNHGQKPIMTNWWHFFDKAPDTAEFCTRQRHANGVERYRALDRYYDEGATFEGMRGLMKRAKFSNAGTLVPGVTYVVSNLTAGAEIPATSALSGGATYELPVGGARHVFSTSRDPKREAVFAFLCGLKQDDFRQGRSGGEVCPKPRIWRSWKERRPCAYEFLCNLWRSRAYTVCKTNYKHLKERTHPMNKTIRNLAIAALFIFPGISGFPQEVQQEETTAVQPVVEENVAFPILIGIP